MTSEHFAQREFNNPRICFWAAKREKLITRKYQRLQYCYNLFLAENALFIMLLWFMQIRCIIITYLLIFPTNRISEGQFLAESYVEAL